MFNKNKKRIEELERKIYDLENKVVQIKRHGVDIDKASWFFPYNQIYINLSPVEAINMIINYLRLEYKDEQIRAKLVKKVEEKQC